MKKLLLHTCCAPCMAGVYERLLPLYDISVFYFNPNISPRREYEARREEAVRFSRKLNFPFIEGRYVPREWTGVVKEFRSLGERSQRCRRCYAFRLEETFREGKARGFDAVTTVLSVSPHKDAGAIMEIGEALSLEYGVDFHGEDFKKKGGFQRSVELSKEHGFYRQSYCGCGYSRAERDGRAPWSKV